MVGISHRLAVSVRRHPVASYFFLAYALSWAYLLPLVATGQTVRVGSRYSHAPSWFSPLLAAVIVTGIMGGRPALAGLWARMTRWRVPARWYVVCLGVPLVMFALAATIGGWPSWADLGKFNGLPAWGVLGVWALEIGWNGLGEETGWRGFALPMLQDRHGPLLGTLLLAVGWAGWHAPYFFLLESYQDFSAGTLVGFFIGLTCGAFVLTWIYNRSGGSILAAAAWHGTYNMTSATTGSRGTIAAVVSTLVMVWGIGLVLLELRARRRGEPSVLGPVETRRTEPTTAQ